LWRNYGGKEEDRWSFAVITLTLFFLGAVNNFVGRSAELGLDNARLAQKLTDYFLQGARAR
jgi:hypothetical protein